MSGEDRDLTVAKKTKAKMKPTIWIVESLGFFDENAHKEGEIISRTLQLSGKRTSYTYLRTRKEFEAFAEEFGNSAYRYLHISCHGYKGVFHTTTDMIKASEFADILVPHVDKRRVFLSTCLAGDDKFAKDLLLRSTCLSVLAPAGDIRFDDAAIFWTAFYHLIFKDNRDSMQNDNIKKNVLQCATLVGTRFHLFYKRDGNVIQELLPRRLARPTKRE
jgi:hypothetical protein